MSVYMSLCAQILDNSISMYIHPSSSGAPNEKKPHGEFMYCQMSFVDTTFQLQGGAMQVYHKFTTTK